MRKLMRVVHGDGGARVMAHDVPFFDVLFDAYAFQRLGKRGQLIQAVRGLRTFSKPGQIDCVARKSWGKAVDNAAPQLAAGGYAVDEQHRIARASNN
jgi:hypothetical protein